MFSRAAAAGLGAWSAKYLKMANVGHGGNVLRLHERHRAVAELRRVIDRRHARLRGKARGRLALAMHAHCHVQPRRLGHRCLELVLGVLVRRVERPERWIARLIPHAELRAERVAEAGRRAGGNHLVRTGRVDLDEARAFLHLRADGLNQLLGVVGVVGVPQHALRRVEANGVLVSTEDRDRVAADAEPRAGNPAGVDSVAHRRIGRPGAFGPHIALGREPGHQVSPGGEHRFDSSLRHRLDHGLHSLGRRLRVQKEVHVRVDQAGHQRHVAQVDHLCPSRMRHRRAGRLDASAVHQHLAGTHDPARDDLEQSRGVQHDRRRRGSGP